MMLRQLLQAAPRQMIRMQTMAVHNRAKIGKREVVGFGLNGSYSYIDLYTHPLPAIRFKEETPDITVIREKEKGDWHKLTLEEKKALYRFSFCQTFREMDAPTGEWKTILGMMLAALALSIWIDLWVITFVYDDLPPTLSVEHQQAQLQRLLDMAVDPIDGLSSRYDYENKKWKK